MRTSRGRSRRAPKRRSYNLGPIIKISAIVLALAGLACIVIFVIVPLFGGEEPAEEAAVVEETPTATVAATPTPAPTPIARADMSIDASEQVIDNYKKIHDPFVHNEEMIFSTSKQPDTAEVDTVAIVDMVSGVTTDVAGIVKQYTSLFEPKMNDEFIVYLDCKYEYGGAVCGYDRASGEAFVMREYLFGKPKVTLSGEYAVWMQQTGSVVDKLYLYHLPTRESTTIEIFLKTPFSVSAPHMDGSSLVYVEPYGERQVLQNSSSSVEAEIVVMPLQQGGDEQAVLFRPGTYVYEPMISGDYIVFLNDPRSEHTELMVCGKSGDTYSAPVSIAQGILNYKVGDGYVVYTLEEEVEGSDVSDIGVYIYYFEDGSTGRLSPDTSRAVLASANGKDVVWYDITDGLGASANVIMHITVP